MKHRIFLFLLLLSAITVQAQKFDYDGLEYSILSEENKTCAVSEQSKTIAGDVVIPSVAEYNNNDYLVVEIGSKAFFRQQLQSIALPSSIVTIGMGAFYNCNKIIDLVIPEKVDSIGAYAFSGCTSLVSVSIPESMKKIGMSAFEIWIRRDCNSQFNKKYWECSILGMSYKDDYNSQFSKKYR